MEFQLNIQLGNEAMESSQDVAEALRALADELDGKGTPVEGVVVDRNGNTVGRWEVSD